MKLSVDGTVVDVFLGDAAIENLSSTSRGRRIVTAEQLRNQVRAAMDQIESGEAEEVNFLDSHIDQVELRDWLGGK